MTAAPAISPLYLVICGIYDPPYTPERYLSDMTWDGTVKDIADRQFLALRQVIEIGTGRDVTAEMLAEAGIGMDAPLTGQDKIEWLDDHRRAMRKETV